MYPLPARLPEPRSRLPTGWGSLSAPPSPSLAVPAGWAQSPRDGVVGARGQSGAWPERACTPTSLHTHPRAHSLLTPHSLPASPAPLYVHACTYTCAHAGQARAGVGPVTAVSGLLLWRGAAQGWGSSGLCPTVVKLRCVDRR